MFIILKFIHWFYYTQKQIINNNNQSAPCQYIFLTEINLILDKKILLNMGNSPEKNKKKVGDSKSQINQNQQQFKEIQMQGPKLIELACEFYLYSNEFHNYNLISPYIMNKQHFKLQSQEFEQSNQNFVSKCREYINQKQITSKKIYIKDRNTEQLNAILNDFSFVTVDQQQKLNQDQLQYSINKKNKVTHLNQNQVIPNLIKPFIKKEQDKQITLFTPSKNQPIDLNVFQDYVEDDEQDLKLSSHKKIGQHIQKKYGTMHEIQQISYQQSNAQSKRNTIVQQAKVIITEDRKEVSIQTIQKEIQQLQSRLIDMLENDSKFLKILRSTKLEPPQHEKEKLYRLGMVLDLESALE